jgi:hypothetical protein
LPNPIYSCPPKAELLLFRITLLARNSLLLLIGGPRLTWAHVSLAA